MNFSGKVNAGMNNLKKSVKNGVDNYKLDGKIAEQKKLIKELKKEIADLVMVRLEAGDEMPPEIMERYAAIQVANNEIAELEKERKISKIICPECGMKTSVEMNYCGKCGACLKSEMMEEVEIVEVVEDAETAEPAEATENIEIV